ncbi:MAG: SulP family inorganic anion transporter [Hyphomicrobiales bacterium]
MTQVVESVAVSETASQIELKNNQGRWPATANDWALSFSVSLISALVLMGVCVAHAALMFSGPLVTGLTMSAGAAMLITICASLIFAYKSQISFSLVHVQDVSVAAIALMLSTTAAVMPGTDETRVATALAIVAMCTFATGIALTGVGVARLGKFVKTLPYSVVAGFLASTGYLLLEGALGMAVSQPANLSIWLKLFGGQSQTSVLLMLLVMIGLILTELKFKSSVYLLAFLLISGAAFHLWIWQSGEGAEAFRVPGFLPTLTDISGPILPQPELVSFIEWSVVLKASPEIAAIALLTLIGTLMNELATERVTKCDVDTNKELKLTGLVNVFLSPMGSPPTYVGLSFTNMAVDMKARTRANGLLLALMMGVGLFYSRDIVSNIPSFMTAGLIAYLGITRLREWLVLSFHRLPILDWLVVCGILLITATVGLFEALASGLIFSMGVFIFNYSRLPVVKLVSDVSRQRSLLERTPEQAKMLLELGETGATFRLQGYIFFGTSDAVVEKIKARVSDQTSQRLKHLLLDFRSVPNLDSAAVVSFSQIRDIAEQNDFDITIAGLNHHTRLTFLQAGFDLVQDEIVHEIQDYDIALERVENSVLAESPVQDLQASFDLREHFMGQGGKDAGKLVKLMQRKECKAGEMVYKTGDKADSFGFLASGRVAIRLASPNGEGRRVRSLMPGACIGDVGTALGLDRTADVVAEQDSVLYEMSLEDLAELQKTNSSLAILFHKIIEINLAEKIVTANRALEQYDR